MAAVELEAVAKESTRAVKQEYKFGKKAIKEYGWIMSFILPGSRRRQSADTQATRHLQAIFCLWNSDEGKLG